MSQTGIQKINNDSIAGKVDLDFVPGYARIQSNHLVNLRTGSSAFKKTEACLDIAKNLLKDVDDLARATVEDDDRPRWP